jgi:ribosomal protein S12 methylthiotransferase accessory factor
MDEARYVTEAAGLVNLADLPDLSVDDISSEVSACVAALRARGFFPYCLDVTHPLLQVPTVYTILPGAHFAHRTTGTDVVFHAAKLASQLPDPAQALAVLTSMTQVAGQAYYAHFFRALVLMSLERPEEALKSLDRALALNPPNQDEASIHTQMGAALKDLGRFIEAKQALTRAASFPEPHHEVFNLLGYCHFMLKEHEQSIEAFGKAIEIEPGQAINYANIGSNLRELGKMEMACQMYRHALDLDPSLEFARLNLEKLSAKG